MEVGFPRAVTGENAERFVAATWRQGCASWRRTMNLVPASAPPDDARDMLGAIAAAELGRPLYSQEDRLLSELLQQTAPAATVPPEIPSFLRDVSDL